METAIKGGNVKFKIITPIPEFNNDGWCAGGAVLSDGKCPECDKAVKMNRYGMPYRHKRAGASSQRLQP